MRRIFSVNAAIFTGLMDTPATELSITTAPDIRPDVDGPVAGAADEEAAASAATAESMTDAPSKTARTAAESMRNSLRESSSPSERCTVYLRLGRTAMKTSSASCASVHPEAAQRIPKRRAKAYYTAAAIVPARRSRHMSLKTSLRRR